MGACCSKNTTTTALTTAPPKSDLKSDHQPPHNTRNNQQVVKKEIFVIKHRISHEIDRHSDQESDKNPSATTGSVTSTGARLRTASCSKDELDSILVQCDRLSRSNSSGAQSQNPNYRRRYSRSKRSFDLGVNTIASASNDEYNNVDDEDDSLNHHRHRQPEPEVRVSSSGRSSSKERRISISPSRRSGSKERRISISPSRRSESPFPAAATGGSSSSNRPVKMVSVPATDKSSNAGPVKRIHVKRNVSPARSTVRVFTESLVETDHRRKSLVEIDNNAARSAHPRDTKRTRKLSRDLDSPSPSAPSYASLLLEDIHNFHKKNTNAVVTTTADFELPECISKACLIMEAVADLNSNTSSLCSDERWRNSSSIKKDRSGT